MTRKPRESQLAWSARNHEGLEGVVIDGKVVSTVVRHPNGARVVHFADGSREQRTIHSLVGELIKQRGRR